MRSSQNVARHALGPQRALSRHSGCRAYLGCRRWVLSRALPPLTALFAIVATRRMVSTGQDTLSAPTRLSPSSQALVGQYDTDRHVEIATAMLQETFGPQARIRLNVIRQRPRRSAATDTGPVSEPDARHPSTTEHTESTAPDAAAPDTYCRASATFQLLSFPVELAAVKSAQPEEAIESCLRQALSSDVEFLTPRRRQRGGHPQGRRTGATPPSLGHANVSSTAGASPVLATVLPELCELCLFFSRSVKFTIKPPRAAIRSGNAVPEANSEDDGDAHTWRCRAYVRDEWAAARHSNLAEERTGDTPRAALTACACALAARYAREKASPEVALAGVRELDTLLSAAQRKRVVFADSILEEGTHRADAPLPPCQPLAAMAAPTVTSTLRVEDRRHNSRTVQLRRQPSSMVGLHAVAMRAIKSEACWDASTHLYDARLPAVPLLVRLRWQFDSMVQQLSALLQRPADSIARIDVGAVGVTRVGKQDSSGELGIDSDDEGAEGTLCAAPSNKRAAMIFAREYRATLTCDDAVVWQMTHGGRYRVELDTYAQGVLLLLDQYGAAFVPSLSAQTGLLFPNAALLELALARHDRMNILTQHRGNWTGYAVLGTITSQLLGAYYQTHYHFDAVSKYWKATLTIQDGRETDQILIERLSLQKGEAWRHACLDALRANFPVQYEAAVTAYPDMDLSTELMSRGGRFRALPRHKRVRHLGTLFDLVSAFAEEDFGWRQLRVRLRNVAGDLGVPQWVAEMEALVDTQRASEWTTQAEGIARVEKRHRVRVDGDEEMAPSLTWRRIVVAESPPYTQVKVARRVLVYRLAAQYFPNELAIYKTLGRADSHNPEETATTSGASHRAQLYDPAKGAFVAQLFAQWEAQHPSLAPFTWHLLLNDTAAPPKSTQTMETTSLSDAEAALAQLLAPLTVPHRVQVYGQNGEVLVRDEGQALASAGTQDAPGNVVQSLTSALKNATRQLDVKAAETLLREFETHEPPPLTSSRDLCVYLFTALLGNGTSADANLSGTSTGVISGEEEDGHQSSPDGALLAVEAVQHAEYWIATLTLPHVRHVALAKAVHSTKRGSVRDALLLATRRAFRPQLEYLAAHSIALSALASEILLEPIVEALPDTLVRDLLHECRRQERRRADASSTESTPRFHDLLHRVQAEFNGSRRLRVQQQEADELQDASFASEHRYTCRLYLDPVTSAATQSGTSASARAVPHVARGHTQLIGQATDASESKALEAACLDALHRLF